MSGTINPLSILYAGDQTGQRPNALAPVQALPAAAAPTPADAWEYNAPVVADAARQAQNPQFWTEAAQQYGNALLMGSTTPGIRAFHGTPHIFDKFDLGKIGTGEGAQAYGHGLYFAENEGVARSYRDNLSVVDPKPWQAQLAQLKDQMTDLTGKIMSGKRGSPEVQAAAAQLDSLADQHANLLRSPPPPNPGHMYEVNINVNPEHMLDWDKPLSEQSQHVRDAVGKYGIGAGYQVIGPNGAVPVFHATVEDAAQAAKAIEGAKGIRHVDPTGGAVYEHSKLVPGDYRDPVAAAQALHAAGIPGIRYLDGGSRSAGEGSSNHVVFDPATIEILRKYGIAGLMAGGGAAAAASDPNAQ